MVVVGAWGCYSKGCLHSTSHLLVATPSRGRPRCLTLEWSLYPSIYSSSSPPTYGSTFACAFQCVFKSFLALSPPPQLGETCPFKATASPLRLISGSPRGDGGKSIMQPPVFGSNVALSSNTSLIQCFGLVSVAVVWFVYLKHKCSQKYLEHVSCLLVKKLWSCFECTTSACAANWQQGLILILIRHKVFTILTLWYSLLQKLVLCWTFHAFGGQQSRAGGIR